MCREGRLKHICGINFREYIRIYFSSFFMVFFRSGSFITIILIIENNMYIKHAKRTSPEPYRLIFH